MAGFQSRSQKAIPVYPADDDGNLVGSSGTPQFTRTAPLPDGIDRSGTTSATAGQSTSVAAAKADRRGLRIQNVSAGTLYVNEFGGTAAAGGSAATAAAGSYLLPAGGTFTTVNNRAVTIAGSAASLAYTATEY